MEAPITHYLRGDDPRNPVGLVIQNGWAVPENPRLALTQEVTWEHSVNGALWGPTLEDLIFGMIYIVTGNFPHEPYTLMCRCAWCAEQDRAYWMQWCEANPDH